MTGDGTLLRVRDLRTYFRTEDGLVRAVDGVSFDIPRGRTFALVGESGCGKSVTAYSIIGLLPIPPAVIASPAFLLRRRLGLMDDYVSPETPESVVEFDGRPLLDLGERELRDVRGRRISMIFQEPMTSLNPVFTCGSQIVEAIRLHRRMSRPEATRLAIDLLDKVGIPDPAERFGQYPHELSGGMRQRVMIAMALSCDPELLIADEPTTALDVTIQAQILDLLRDLQAGSGLSILMITHDLAVVAETAHEVGVMYASKIVERAGVEPLFAEPLHPYTQGLFRSVPRLGERKDRLETIPGTVPNPLRFPTGCKFHPRCPVGRDLPRCRTREPELLEVRPDHWCACWECPGYEQAATDAGIPPRLDRTSAPPPNDAMSENDA